VSGSARRPRTATRSYAQHFLRSDRLAVELAREAEIGDGDLVVEFGAGRGALTAALVARTRHVLAIEVDPVLVDHLVGRFASEPAVTVLAGDALAMPLPASPYRVVANLPFNRTTSIFRRLFDPRGGLQRADLIVERGVADKRAAASAGPPMDLLGVTWAPWWHFRRGRRLPRQLFRPAPSVDAAVLVAWRRARPPVEPDDYARYAAFVRSVFERPSGGVHGVGVTSDGLGPHERRARREPRRPVEIGLEQWAQLFRRAR